MASIKDVPMRGDDPDLPDIPTTPPLPDPPDTPKPGSDDE
jgi:hypothetical protein